MGITEDFYLTIPRGSYDSLSVLIDMEPELIAPLQINSAIGHIRISLDGEQVSEVPLVTLYEVLDAGLWVQIKDQVMLWAQ